MPHIPVMSIPDMESPSDRRTGRPPIADGTPEARFTDDGTGTWVASGAAPSGPLRWLGLNGTEHTGAGDVDGDGVADRFIDTDRDGLADRALQAGGDGASRTGYVDTDRDGRWDVMLTDADGDGSADGGASPFRP